MRALVCVLVLGAGDSPDPPAAGVTPDEPVRGARDALETHYTGPPDPVIPGECELHVRLFDAESGDGVRSRAVLWKLDASANGHWQRGDQALGFATLDAASAPIRFLERGRYRFLVGEQRYGDDDPPEFVVDGPTTELRLEIRTARTLQARLRILREDGRALGRALVSSREPRKSQRHPSVRLLQRWVTVREGASEECRPKPYSSCCYAAAPYGEPVLRSVDEHGWIALCDIKEDSHAWQRNVEFKLAPIDDPRPAELFVAVVGHQLADQDYLCLLPGDRARRAVLESIRYREGDPPVGPEHLDSSARAVLASSLPERASWRHAPIRATLRHPAYEKRIYRFTLADPPQQRFLARIEAR